MKKIKCYLWTDQTGRVHTVPDGACTICAKCSDIFLDPLKQNEIYACVCSLPDHESSELSRRCPDFELDKEDIEGVIYQYEKGKYDHED